MSMNKLLSWKNPSRWSRLSRTEHNHPSLRVNILFSQLCVLGCVFTVIQSIDDFLELNLIMMTVDLFVFFLMILCHRLNERGQHLLSKTMLLGFLNLLFFFLASVIDPISKMDLLYYPLLILNFMTLGREGIKRGFVFVIISFALLMILEFTDHHPFGHIDLQQGTRIQGFINIFTACFFISLAAIFFVNLSDKSEKSLRRKKDELTKANAELDKFVYSASHDMRAPLMSIQGLVNIASQESSLDQVRAYLKMIHERTHKLDEFVKDVTNYSRNSKLDLDLKNEDISEIVFEAVEKIKFLDGFAAIAFEIQAAQNFSAKTDKSRLSVVLNNLLTNAVKYHDLKKIEPFIKVIIENGFNHFKIKIIDNGSGIKAEHIEKIFNMFYRGTEKSQGSGLGLYIVKELIEKMGGTISVRSDFGIGTEFEIVLPNYKTSQPMMKVA